MGWFNHQPEEQFFIRLLCHQSMREAAAAPGQDIFLPGNDCSHAYVIQSGVMTYHGKDGREVCATNDQNSSWCLPALWAVWHNHGRFSADNGLCYYVTIDAENFCTASVNYGGPIYAHLQIFGILLVGHVEGMEDDNLKVGDMMDELVMSELRVRAQQYCAYAGDIKKKRYKASILEGFKLDDSTTMARFFGSRQGSESGA